MPICPMEPATTKSSPGLTFLFSIIFSSFSVFFPVFILLIPSHFLESEELPELSEPEFLQKALLCSPVPRQAVQPEFPGEVPEAFPEQAEPVR